MKKYILENKFVITFIVLLFIWQILYLHNTALNIPIMDYWKYIDDIGPKIMNGTLEIKDFWASSAGIHKNPMVYVLLAINIKYLGYNTMYEIYAGALFMLILSFVLLYYYINTKEKKLSILKQLLFCSIIMCVYNYNQWEILLLEYSMAFMFRILVYVIIFICFSKCLVDMKRHKNCFIFLTVLLIPIILFISQIYFVALVASLIIAIFLNFVLSFKKDRLSYIKYYIIFAIIITISSCFYFYGTSLGGMPEKTIISFLYDMNFYHGVILMLGATIFPHGIWDKVGYQWVFFTGCFVAFLYLFSTILYFKFKMYKKSFIPIMLLLYSLINIAMIVPSRIYAFSVNYVVASRYTVETNLGIIGTLWILLDCLTCFHSYSTRRENHKYYRAFSCLFIGIVVLCLIISAKVENNRSIYRKQYYQTAIDRLTDIDNLPDEDLSIFQAYPEQVRKAAQFMQEYKLGAFNEKQLAR